MAEIVGFEPTDGLPSTVFKTASFGHSDISPRDTIVAQKGGVGKRYRQIGWRVRGKGVRKAWGRAGKRGADGERRARYSRCLARKRRIRMATNVTKRLRI